MPIQETSQVLRGQSFRGVNLQLPPERLPASDVQLADNMWVIGGEFYTRPGKHGMLAALLGGPIYSLTAYAASDGSQPPNITTWLMFVCLGKLYVAQAGQSAPPTEIKIGGTGGVSFGLNSATVRMHRVGQYMYIVDGVGPLYKVLIPYVNPSTAYTAIQYVGLAAPTSAFAASLTNQVIDPTNDITKWSSFPALTWPGAVTVSNAETINATSQAFTGGASGGGASSQPPPTGWITGGDTMDFQGSITGVGMELAFDAGAGAEWCDWDYPAPVYAAGTNTIGNARVFVASGFGHSGGGGSFGMQVFPEAASVTSSTLIKYTDLVIVTSGATSTISSAAHPFQSANLGNVVTVFSGVGFTPGNYTITAVNAGTHVATVNGNIGTAASTGGTGTLNLDAGYGSGGNIWGNKNSTLQNPPSAIIGADQASPIFKCSGANTKYEQTFSFTGHSGDFDYTKFRIIGPAANSNMGVNTPSFKVVDVRLIIETSSNGTLHLKANNPVGAGANCLGGCWIKRDYTGSPGGFVDYSGSNTLSVRYSAPATTPAPSTGGIPWRFGFLKAGQPIANIAWSNVATYTTDGSAFYCDCSTIDPLIRAQTAFLFLQIATDLPVTINPGDLCTLGPISTSGNLTLHELFGGWGGDYSYQYTKVNAANDSTYFIDVVESDPSPMSVPPAQPNGVSNQVTFPLPASPGDGTTHWAIYRFGGVFADGLGRLIARVPIGADQATDAQHQFSWNHTTRVFIDNTTDSSLEVNIPTFLLTGRTPLPIGATCITEWNSHMVAAIGSQVYISWAIQSGNNTGLYFNQLNVNDPNDIAQSVKGALFDTGGADNDPIQNVIALGPYVAVMKQRSIFLITGTDAASFGMSAHMVRAGVGLTAPLAWVVIGLGLRFLGPDGVYHYDGVNDPQSMSDDIEPALNPKSRNAPALQAAAYASSFMVWHGRRLYLCAPGSAADTSPSVLWVWDSRVHDGDGGWVRWTGMNFTSAASLTQATNTDDLYFAGRDGQIYQITGAGDTVLSTDTPAAIPISFMSRALGQEATSQFGAEIIGPYYFNIQTPNWLQINVVTRENVTLTFGVYAAATPAFWTHPYVVNNTQLCIRKEVANYVQGVNCWATVNASSVTPITIKRIALELSEGHAGVN
jgi:hypothetical protein